MSVKGKIPTSANITSSYNSSKASHNALNYTISSLWYFIEDGISYLNTDFKKS